MKYIGRIFYNQNEIEGYLRNLPCSGYLAVGHNRVIDNFSNTIFILSTRYENDILSSFMGIELESWGVFGEGFHLSEDMENFLNSRLRRKDVNNKPTRIEKTNDLSDFATSVVARENIKENLMPIQPKPIPMPVKINIDWRKTSSNFLSFPTGGKQTMKIKFFYTNGKTFTATRVANYRTNSLNDKLAYERVLRESNPGVKTKIQENHEVDTKDLAAYVVYKNDVAEVFKLKPCKVEV